MDKLVIVAIDGGAATGKSSTAKGIAARLGLLHVDTGSHYRVLTHEALRRGFGAAETPAFLRFLEGLELGTRREGLGLIMTVDGREIPPEEIRSETVTRNVSAYAACPAVRRKLLGYQRSLAAAAEAHRDVGGLVVEGRDIGSVVFPDAARRFFLEADAATREARREAQGERDAISDRDRADAGRKTAPLVCPDGAERIDTGRHSLEAVIEMLCEKICPILPTGSSGC